MKMDKKNKSIFPFNYEIIVYGKDLKEAKKSAFERVSFESKNYEFKIAEPKFEKEIKYNSYKVKVVLLRRNERK